MVITKHKLLPKIALSLLFTGIVFSFSSPTVHAVEDYETFEDGTKIDTNTYGKGSMVENGFNFRDDAMNGKNAFKYLQKNYQGVFTLTKDLIGHKNAQVHYNKYDADNFRTIFYGNATDASHLQINDYVGSQRRYIGVEYTMKEPTHNPKVSYDYCTDGTLLARKVLNRPTNNPGSIPTANNLVKNGSKKYNYNDTVKLYYEVLATIKSGKVKQLQDMSGREIREEWADLIYDKYADDDTIAMNKQQKHAGCYLRPKYGISNMHANHIQLKYKDPIDRIDHFHVTVPPTELTDGQAYEWHNGSNYDGFRLSYKANANFKAVEIKTKKVGKIIEATLLVKNTMSHYVDTGTGIPAEFVVTEGSGHVLYSGLSLKALPKWQAGETKEIPLFNNYMLDDKYVGQELEIYANFNPDQGDAFYETSYSDNSTSTKIKIDGDPANDCDGTCIKSFFGTTKSYGQLETQDDSDTLVCNTYTVTLNNATEVSTNKHKYTTLTGVWSSNTNGHYNHKSDIEAKDVGEKDTLRATGTPQFSGDHVINTKVTNFKVPGIKKLGRVIRSGRSIEMYSGIHIRITAESFTSYNKAESTINKMYDYMTGKTDKNKFVSRGNRTTGRELKNNLGKIETPAQIDGHRAERVVKTSKTKTHYGDCGDTLTKYSVVKEFFVPIATKNAGGKQKTQNGDFAPSKDYNVTNDKYALFTSIDSPDGIYNIFFRNYVKPSIFEGGSGPEEFCDTNYEKVIIQGNLYDDVRTEDKTDSNTIKDLGW
ncbi:hypothetical protein [Rummeliibacillus suwonensis]|uniref:hypothetical protein n=1 Tax=Rummeliibacillus suwonensis TaxID=1306154 RepID=UPI00289D5049|nr:hypothetical protein [Rummeliibacillus suwonensis]